MSENEIKRQREEHLDDTSGPKKEDAADKEPAKAGDQKPTPTGDGGQKS